MEPSILHQNPKTPKGQEVISCSNLVSGLDTGENRTICSGPFSLGMRFSESLSMTTDLGLFRVILDRMSNFKSLKIKVLSQILRKSVESQS
jgi:hypothetical protein